MPRWWVESASAFPNPCIIASCTGSAYVSPSVCVVQTRLIGSFFFVPMIFGLNSKYGTGAGALAGMVGGSIGCVSWAWWGIQYAPNIDAIEVGIAANALCYFTVSALTRPQRPQPPVEALA